MSPYEVMLSESQERMLLAIAPENLAAVKAVFGKWDVTCREIGLIIADQVAQVADGSVMVAGSFCDLGSQSDYVCQPYGHVQI